VKPGESLSVIASRYGKSTGELKDYNKLKSTSVWVGQKLKIPGQQAKSEKVAPIVALLKTVTHTVKSGESLSVIASRYDKGTNELKEFNHLKSTSLKVGQKLKIPGQHSEVVKLVKVETPKNVVHRVKSGESLSVIASSYGRSTSELKAFNNLRTSSIQVGQKLKIPDADYREPVAAVKSKIITHKVKSGESLSVIASRYRTTSTVLKAYNKLSSSALRVNQIIKIPTSSTQFTKHKVRSGESLSVIASRYGTTTLLLKAFNQLSSNALFVGQVLTVPTT
jgi:N-acetylmuramoyl-L-alanine amidase